MRWVELVVSVAYGVAAAVLPLFNNEAYVVASQAAGLAAAVPVAVGLGIGNGVGKTLVVWLVRRGRSWPWWRSPRPADGSATGGRSRWRRWSDRLLGLVGDPRWGGPLVALSAATSIPPVYPVTLVAATTRMPLAWFWATNTLGSVVRMLALAWLTRGVVS